MEVRFIGAARHVTGSKHLLTLPSGKQALLDCGLFQGKRKETDSLNRHWGFEPRDISYLILSHAHIDHCGLIPKLVKDGFRGKIYCTPATYDLCSIMLPDSAHIQEDDAFFDNKKRAKDLAAGKKVSRHPVEPLYTTEDAEKCLEYFETIPYETPFTPDDGVTFTFYDAGHLLGSAGIYIQWQDSGVRKSLFFTGDIGRAQPQMLREPQRFPQADYIICESTYGDRLHDDDDYTITDLVNIIRETCIERNGKLIIPAFSIGRTQEIIYALDYLDTYKQLPPIDVYVDSPLSSKGTTIFRKHLELFNDQMQQYLKTDPDPFGFPNLHFIESVDESKALNEKEGPCIIISSSGMMDAGRIRHHVFNHIEDPTTTILMVGYSEPASLGGRLAAGVPAVKLFGEYKQVNARIEYIRSYSGHGDYKEMIRYLNCQKIPDVKKIFLVHGDYPVQVEFSRKLQRVGFHDVVIPSQGDHFIL